MYSPQMKSQLQIKVIVLVSFYELDTNWGFTWRKGTSVKELPLSEWPVGMSMRHFLGLLLMRKGPEHCGGTNLGQVVIDCIKRQVEQTKASE